MDSKNNSKYLFLLITGVFLLLSYLIIKDFLISILNAMVLTFIFYPLYNWIYKKTKRKYLSSLIVTIILILFVAFILILLLNSLAKETTSTYSYLNDKINNYEPCTEDADSYKCKIVASTEEFIKKYNLESSLENTLISAGKAIYSNTFLILFKIPSKIINVLIMIFIIFFLFAEGDQLVRYIRKTLPFEKRHQINILEQIKDTIYAVIYGQIIIAVIQGILGGLIFALLGISNPVLWGVVMAILALLPIVGASFVWIPAALYLLIQGFTGASTIMIVKAVILSVYGVVLIGGIDILLKPKVIGKRSKLHPIIILIGILGGLKVFGISGLILGPVILGVMVTLIKIYEEER